MSKQELDAIYEMMEENAFPEDAAPELLRESMDAAAANFPVPESVTITETEIAGVAAEWLVGPTGKDGPVMLYLHGGGYVAGSLKSHRHLVAYLADKIGGRVLNIDYRLAPEHPFPAQIEDAIAVYAAMLDDGIDPANLFIGGDSAGGGLTMATLLSARDKGLPMPAGAILFSPWMDMTVSGETLVTKADVDPSITPTMVQNTVNNYLGGADPNDPLASPIFADLSGMPPILIQTGENEVLLSDSQTLNSRLIEAGSQSQLEVWSGMFHVWHQFWPMLSEARDALDGAAKFIADHR